jgi:hypothetical protein
MPMTKPTFSRDQQFFLDHLYFLFNREAGWVFKLEKWLNLGKHEVRYLEELDDLMSGQEIEHDRMLRKMNIEILTGILFADTDDEKLKILTKRINDCYVTFDGMKKQDIDWPTRKTFLMICDLEAMEALRKRIVRGMWTSQPVAGQITPEMIDRAREYPMLKLVEHERLGRVRCIFHPDKNPSGWVKNNFFYCFTCMAWADSIKWVMTEKRVGFKDAVRMLQ